ncbi:OpgC domain-containing protein [Frigidibacter sp. MR17.14]|uniref:OpgC family protein n=1 Tax=Frigidibacter sp. MR17.14 TaxID=3126509 RepID=UPI003012F8AB
MRLNILDGFRGFFLVFMMVAHANAYLNAPLGHINHHYFGWVEDAQGFVFISGLVVGLVYAKRLMRKGPQAMRAGIFARVRTIYTYHAGLILAFLAAALLLPLAGIEAQILKQQATEPVVFTLAEALLFTGTLHMGILPMYLVFMVATPAVLTLFHRGQGVVVLAGSICLWLFAQTGWPDLAQLPVEGALAGAGHGINIGIYFNIFAWQALFVGGLWLGWLLANGRLDLERLKRPEMQTVFWIAFAGFLILGILDVMAWSGMGEPGWRKMMFSYIDRGNLAPIYVVAFVVNLYMVTWLVVAGRHSRNRVLAWAGEAFHWLFTREALVMLGRHSLQIFATHVVLVYILSIWMQDRELAPMAANVALVAMLAPLWIVAVTREWLQGNAPVAAKPVPVTVAAQRRK